MTRLRSHVLQAAESSFEPTRAGARVGAPSSDTFTSCGACDIPAGTWQTLLAPCGVGEETQAYRNSRLHHEPGVGDAGGTVLRGPWTRGTVPLPTALWSSRTVGSGGRHQAWEASVKRGQVPDLGGKNNSLNLKDRGSGMCFCWSWQSTQAAVVISSARKEKTK